MLHRTRRLERLIGGLALTASLAVISSHAWALGSTADSSVSTYATQAITSTSTVTLPGSITLTSTPSTTGTATVTFTLPTGWTFASTPGISCTGGFVCVSLASGGSGANTVVENVTTTATTAGTVVIGSGATVTNTNLATAQTANIATSCNVATVCTAVAAAPIAVSTSALTYATTAGLTAGETQVIDVGSVGLGKQYKPTGSGTAPCAGTNGTDQVCADLGEVTLTSVSTTTANGTSAFTFGATSGTITLIGNWSGVSAFLTTPTAAATTACKATAALAAAQANSIQGTITGSSLTFANVNGGTAVTNPFTTLGNTVDQEICLYATGSSILGANVGSAITSSISAGPTVSVSDAALLLASIGYNGTVQQILYTGTFKGGYTAFLRFVNNSATPLTVIGVVQTEAGAVGSTQAATVGANSNSVVAVSTIITASGVTLDSTGRASLLLLTPGATA